MVAWTIVVGREMWVTANEYGELSSGTIKCCKVDYDDDSKITIILKTSELHTSHFKRVHCMLCELYIKKAVQKEMEDRWTAAKMVDREDVLLVP